MSRLLCFLTFCAAAALAQPPQPPAPARAKPAPAGPADGAELWQFNTAQQFETVNGVPGKGGSLGDPGPAIAGGMLYAGSGYIGTGNGMPGNVLLALRTGIETPAQQQP